MSWTTRWWAGPAKCFKKQQWGFYTFLYSKGVLGTLPHVPIYSKGVLGTLPHVPIYSKGVLGTYFAQVLCGQKEASHPDALPHSVYIKDDYNS